MRTADTHTRPIVDRGGRGRVERPRADACHWSKCTLCYKPRIKPFICKLHLEPLSWPASKPGIRYEAIKKHTLQKFKNIHHWALGEAHTAEIRWFVSAVLYGDNTRKLRRAPPVKRPHASILSYFVFCQPKSHPSVSEVAWWCGLGLLSPSHSLRLREAELKSTWEKRQYDYWMWVAAVKKLILSSFSWLYINSAAFCVITTCPWGWWQSPPQGFPVILPLITGRDDAERSKNWNRAGSDRKWLQMLSLWKNYTITLNWIRSEEHRNLFLWTNKHSIKNNFHPKIKFTYFYSSATISFIHLDGFGVSCSVL